MKGASSSAMPFPGKVVVVGATGGTGASAIAGLIHGGAPPSSLHLLTRDPSSHAAKSLLDKFEGVNLVQGNLDSMEELCNALQGAEALYVHGTSADTSKPNPAEVERARSLADTACEVSGVQLLVYNSAAGNGYGGERISVVRQKAEIESIYREKVPTTCLRPTLFMDELWKKYTRPSILDGTFPFAMPSDKPLQLVSVFDVGRAAAVALSDPSKFADVSVELAGDEIDMNAMARAFGDAQKGKPRCQGAVVHKQLPRWPIWLLNRELYSIASFYSEVGFRADLEDCERTFGPFLSLRDFLEVTGWGDFERSYTDGIKYDLGAISSMRKD